MSSLTPSRNEWLDSRPIGGRHLSLMDHLFNRLDGMYPHRWRSAFPSEDAIRNWREAWADAFIDAGITPEQVAHGIRVCTREYDWPPSVCEFIHACQPRIDPEAAFIEATRELHKRATNDDRWTHPAIFWATRHFADQDLMGSAYMTIKNRWTGALTEELAKGSWPEIPQRSLSLPAPGQSIASPEKVKQYIEDLKRKMAMPKGVA